MDDHRDDSEARQRAPTSIDDRRAGTAAAHGDEQNLLLRALSLDDYERILPELTSVRLHLRQVLVEPNQPIRDVYFLRQGVASILATEQLGEDMEVGTIGNDGLVGIPLLLGDDRMPNRIFIQVEGEAARISAEAFGRLLRERPASQSLFLRYVSYFTNQLSQSVACNRLHTIEERCARWVLMTHDRVTGDEFELTHEFLSLMLGVRRAGVTVAMGTLQSAGIVRYVRGRLTILDRGRLEEASCDCYHITREALGRLLGSRVG